MPHHQPTRPAEIEVLRRIRSHASEDGCADDDSIDVFHVDAVLSKVHRDREALPSDIPKLDTLLCRRFLGLFLIEPDVLGRRSLGAFWDADRFPRRPLDQQATRTTAQPSTTSPNAALSPRSCLTRLSYLCVWERGMLSLSNLKAAVAELKGFEPGDLADAELTALIRKGRALIDSFQGSWLTWVAEMDRRRAYRAEGATSTTAFLASECGMSGGEAEKAKLVGRALEEMPQTKRALAEGRLSIDKARLLARAQKTHGDGFSEAEGELLQAAEEETVSELGKRVESWGRQLDHEAAQAGLLQLRHRRGLHLRRDPLGMGRIEADADPDSYELIAAAIGIFSDPGALDPDDHRTPPQRRLDAVTEICRRSLGGTESAAGDKAAGERTAGDKTAGDTAVGDKVTREKQRPRAFPHINLLVSLEALEGHGGTCEHATGGHVLCETARRYSCDATLCRVVMKGPELLDLGRMTRVISAGLRRAVILRDRHCRWPGCDHPATWGDVHHIIHWADGGATALQNLCVLCRRHHTATHEDGFSISHDGEGGLVFRRPDGSAIGRAPPAAA